MIYWSLLSVFLIFGGVCNLLNLKPFCGWQSKKLPDEKRKKFRMAESIVYFLAAAVIFSGSIATEVFEISPFSLLSYRILVGVMIAYSFLIWKVYFEIVSG